MFYSKKKKESSKQ